MNKEQLHALMTQCASLLLVLGLTVAMIGGVCAVPRIPQSQSYHSFADQRTLLGISNFLDVMSNAPFFLVGLMGLLFLWQQRKPDGRAAFTERSEQWPYVALFLGVVLTCFGSAYYHLAPNNTRLVWDRLPMTLIFMSFLTATIAERISIKAGLRLLLPLVSIGIGSVIYWHLSELRGLGDLRPYIMVQFYPMIAIPLIVLLFPSRYTRSADVLAIGALYAVAKVFELLDAEIFALGWVVSGHTLKHLVAATATYWMLRMLRKRHPFPSELRSTLGSERQFNPSTGPCHSET